MSNKKERFINDDFKFSSGVRTAPKITKEELLQKIFDSENDLIKNDSGDLKECIEDRREDAIYYTNKEVETKYWVLYEIIRSILGGNIENGDLIYTFDTENVCLKGINDYDENNKLEDDIYRSFITEDNGLTYILVAAGGDWETPVYNAIYWDGKKVRVYQPTYGNSVNADFKSAFGSEWDSYCEGVDEKDIYNRYVNEGLIPENWEELQDETESEDYYPTTIYAAKYNIEDPYDIDANIDAMREEIKAAITVF